jgi:hypothetical protein
VNIYFRRNRGRFPDDFLFELTAEEFSHLKSHFATSSWGGRRKLPLAFTEHGAIMTATILNSPRAIEMSVYIVRAFVQLRELLSSNKELAKRLDQLEARIEKKLATHDEAIAAMLSAIRELMHPPAPKRRGIGRDWRETVGPVNDGGTGPSNAAKLWRRFDGRRVRCASTHLRVGPRS